MADKRKGKGPKATGQRKSAKQLVDISNKENSLEQVVTTERPKPRPLKNNAEPQHTKRNSSIEGESDDDEGAAMAAEALLTIQKGKPFLGRALSPMERIFQQVVPGCQDDNSCGNEVDDVSADIDNANSSDEDGMSFALVTKAVSNQMFLQIMGRTLISWYGHYSMYHLRFHSKAQLETYKVSHHTPCSLSFSRLLPSGWRHASHY